MRALSCPSVALLPRMTRTAQWALWVPSPGNDLLLNSAATAYDLHDNTLQALPTPHHSFAVRITTGQVKLRSGQPCVAFVAQLIAERVPCGRLWRNSGRGIPITWPLAVSWVSWIRRQWIAHSSAVIINVTNRIVDAEGIDIHSRPFFGWIATHPPPQIGRVKPSGPILQPPIGADNVRGCETGGVCWRRSESSPFSASQVSRF